MLDAIPLERPNTPLLDSIDEPADLRELEVEQLETLAHELREFLLFSVGKTGGHFGAGLRRCRAHLSPALCFRYAQRHARVGRRTSGLPA
jgi:hypothetical protein